MSQGPPPTPPQQGLPPVSHPFPGSLTPGWNDPPPIQYNSQPTVAAGRTKLNKRVPFPLQQNINTTKPTAIVQPCPPAPTITATGNSGNIAVVYPIQYANQGMTSHATRVPTLPNSVDLTSTLPGAESMQPTTSPPLPPLQMTTTSCVPTMSVPAVPRQNANISSNVAVSSVTTSSPAIQHL